MKPTSQKEIITLSTFQFYVKSSQVSQKLHCALNIDFFINAGTFIKLCLIIKVTDFGNNLILLA